MAQLKVTYRFPHGTASDGDQINVNFEDVESLVNAFVLQQNYTALSASDVNGPDGKCLLLLVRDSTNGGSALILYESGQTPSIVATVAGAGTTFVSGAPGAGQIGVKNRTGGVAFRADASTNNAVVKATTLIAET